jgi:hypothetical protein
MQDLAHAANTELAAQASEWRYALGTAYTKVCHQCVITLYTSDTLACLSTATAATTLHVAVPALQSHTLARLTRCIIILVSIRKRHPQLS